MDDCVRRCVTFKAVAVLIAVAPIEVDAATNISMSADKQATL
jgi:hypothetical protein